MKKIIFLLLTFTAVFYLFSCGGGGPEDSEIRTTVESLVADAAPLNEIYFGKGLPSDILRPGVGNYMYISSDAEYGSIEQIKEATREIFSAEYSEILFENAFSGTNEEGIGINYALYAEKNGELMINSKAERMITGTRIYHFDTIKVIKKSSETVFVEIDTEDDSGAAAKVKLKLVSEDGKWLLDSPTY